MNMPTSWALDRRYPDEPGLSTAHRIPGLGTAAVAGSCHASGLCLSDCDSRRSVDSRRQWEPAVALGQPRALPWFDAPLSMGAEDDLTARLAGTGRTISDIDLLVATHFDFDHSGNTDLFDDSGIQCFVQAALLDDAMAGDRSEPGLWNRPGVRYVSVTGDYALAPGITLLESSGHATGHQSLLVEIENGSLLLAVDAIPDAPAMGSGPFPSFYIEDQQHGKEAATSSSIWPRHPALQ